MTEFKTEITERVTLLSEQTAILIKQNAENTVKLDTLLENQSSIHEIIGRHDVELINLKRKIG